MTQTGIAIKQDAAVASMNIEGLISQAIDKGIAPETMQKFMEMRRELKAEWAKEQFGLDMAALQSVMPVIDKSKAGGQTQNGKVAYMYAPLDAIIKQVGGLIATHKFSYSFKTENTATSVKVTCIVKHSAGHSEESTMETSLATKTNIMSAPQQIAATVTFNKRYAFCNAFGIMTGDEDTDGPQGKAEPLLATDEQRRTIDNLAAELKVSMADIDKGCRAKLGVSYDRLTVIQAEGVIAGLNQKLDAKK